MTTVTRQPVLLFWFILKEDPHWREQNSSSLFFTQNRLWISYFVVFRRLCFDIGHSSMTNNVCDLALLRSLYWRKASKGRIHCLRIQRSSCTFKTKKLSLGRPLLPHISLTGCCCQCCELHRSLHFHPAVCLFELSR